jgi:hypothetical protein
MKNLILILLAFLVTSDLEIYAQAQAPSIIIESNGKIKGKDAKGNQVILKAGTAMLPNTTFELCKKSSIVMLENDKFKFINEKGEYTTKSKAQDANSASILNFDPTFAEFIKASLAIVNQNIHHQNFKIKDKKILGDGWGVSDPGNTGGWGVSDPENTGGWGVSDPGNTGGWGVSDPGNTGGWGVSEPKNNGGGVLSDPKNNGGWGVNDPRNNGGWGVNDPRNNGGWGVNDPRNNVGWGVNDPGNNGGWGVNDMTINIQTPGGLYEPKKVNVSWIPQDDVEAYLVIVVNEDLKLIKRETTQASTITFDLSDLNPGESYYWQVLAKEKKAVSIPVTFDVASAQDIKEINDLPKDSEIYTKVGKATQGMMHAVAFEEQGMLALSMKTYEELSLKHPNNSLLKINYIAFCMRMGMTSKARELAEGI